MRCRPLLTDDTTKVRIYFSIRVGSALKVDGTGVIPVIPERETAAMRSDSGSLLARLESIPENDSHADHSDGKPHVSQIVVILLYLRIKLLLRHHLAQPVAESSENHVPRSERPVR